MNFYVKRKAFIIDTLNRELITLSNRAAFIKAIIDGNLKINNIPKKQIILWLEAANFDEVDGSYSYLLSMQIHNLTKEKYEELLLHESEKKRELLAMKKVQPADMYVNDLNDLKKVLKKEYN